MAGGVGSLANLQGKVNGNNELVVSATVNSSGGAISDGVDDLLKATVVDLTASNPLAVAIVDTNGDQIASFGGGTQYTEDAAAAANPVGTAVILVREDARAGSLTSADGDNVAQRGNNKGEAYIIDTDLNAAVGTATTAAVSGDNNGSAVAHLRGLNTNITAVLDLGNGRVIVDGSEVTQPVSDAGGSLTVDNAALSVTGGGVEATALRVTIASDSTGVLSIDDNGGAITVDGTVAVSGTVAVTDNAGSLTVDNAALAVVGGGVEATALRVTLASDSTGVVSVDDNGGSLTIDGNIGTVTTVTTVSSVTAIANALPAGTNNIGDVDVLTVNAQSAHDAAIAGLPVRTAGRAASADITTVATGDTTDFVATLTGKQVVMPKALPGATWQYASVSGGVTDTADDVAKASAGAGVRNYITHVDVVNGHATVSTEVVIKDGSTVIWRSYASAAGGGVSADFDPPLRGTAATAVNVTNITTGSATYFNLSGYTAAE